MPGNFVQAKSGCGMIASTEAEAGVEDDDRLAFARAAFDPARLDEQAGADDERFEMPFPGLGPILTANAKDFDFSRPHVEAARFDCSQSFAQSGASFGIVFRFF